MTGPEHYAEAQRLLDLAATQEDWPSGQYLTSKAHVHATLALVAVQAEEAGMLYPVIPGVFDEPGPWSLVIR